MTDETRWAIEAALHSCRDAFAALETIRSKTEADIINRTMPGYKNCLKLLEEAIELIKEEQLDTELQTAISLARARRQHVKANRQNRQKQ